MTAVISSLLIGLNLKADCFLSLIEAIKSRQPTKSSTMLIMLVLLI